MRDANKIRAEMYVLNDLLSAMMDNALLFAVVTTTRLRDLEDSDYPPEMTSTQEWLQQADSIRKTLNKLRKELTRAIADPPPPKADPIPPPRTRKLDLSDDQ